MEQFNRERSWWSEFGQAIGPPIDERDWEEVEIYELIMNRLKAAADAEEARRRAEAAAKARPRGPGLGPG